MKLKLFLILCISFSANAQNLSEILNSLSASKAAQSIKERGYSEIAVSELAISNEAPELGLNVAHARDSVEEGIEYGIAISQNVAHPFSSSTKNRAAESMSKSIKQEVKHELHLMTLETASRYHDACISKEIRDNASLLYSEQNRRFMQFSKAYELGDISRNSLLFNKLDLAKLKQKLSSYEREYLVEVSNLQELVDNLKIDDVSCDDMFDISKDVELISPEMHGEIKKLNYEADSSKAFYKVYDSMFQSIGYELSYEQELDTQRVTFALNLPLSSLTSENEKQKAFYLHENSAKSSQKDALTKEITSASKSLQLKLKTLFDEYTLLRDEILPLSQELLKLSKSALIEGEGTIMEYLDASRSYSENKLEILQIKKNYYNKLFKLYKRADLELGENYENIY